MPFIDALCVSFQPEKKKKRGQVSTTDTPADGEDAEAFLLARHSKGFFLSFFYYFWLMTAKDFIQLDQIL